jgi:hybrid cluster-associated redox disulfide protein
MERIYPQTNLKALFSQWPATIPVFLHHQMSCVGCSMSVFDNLGEAVANYQLEWPAFLSELYAAIELRAAAERKAEPGKGWETDPVHPT